jgi:hypothetical protein
MADDRPPKRYEDIDSIKDVDGVVAVFTRNKNTNRIAVAFFKEFDRDGEGDIERTAFMNSRHLDAVLRLIPQVRKRFEEFQTQIDREDSRDARAASSAKRLTVR